MKMGRSRLSIKAVVLTTFNQEKTKEKKTLNLELRLGKLGSLLHLTKICNLRFPTSDCRTKRTWKLAFLFRKIQKVAAFNSVLTTFNQEKPNFFRLGKLGRLLHSTKVCNFRLGKKKKPQRKQHLNLKFPLGMLRFPTSDLEINQRKCLFTHSLNVSKFETALTD